MDLNYLVMVLFLILGTCANLPFFVRSIRDTFCSSAKFSKTPAAPSALLTTSLAELMWVLPCFVQCAIQLFNGDGPWSPGASKTGCDVMGLYSVFASIAGMTSTLWVAMLTVRSLTGRAPYTAKHGALVGVAIFIVSALFAALPLMGVGSFHYTGEGFCYIDFRNTPQTLILLLITLPTVVATIGLLSYALKIGGWPSQLDLYIMAGGFLSAWTLWVPACLMGLAGASFPRGFFISGGIMGHLQALINPYIYGIRWRSSVLAMEDGAGVKKMAVTPDATELGATPAQAAVLASPV